LATAPGDNRTVSSFIIIHHPCQRIPIAQGFETYALKNGGWPPNAGTGAVPTGMSGEIKDTAWTTLRNSVGGRWNWDRNLNGFAAAISCVGVTASDAQMMLVDAKIDDGDLTTGLFQKAAGRFVYVIEQ
jgi:hypothetical protein